jgi:LCP family protein required for cell wall assembly
MSLRNPVVRLVGCVSLCVALLAGILSAAWTLLSPSFAAGETYLDIQKFAESKFTDGAPTAPFFFLALGNDSREANVNGLGDSIHVIGINPTTMHGTMFNVPRDTEAPDGGKINAFHSNGGLPGIVGQLNKMMGIQINYAITTDFPRFIDMVNEMGGIKINIPYDLSDSAYSGADFRPGPTKVTGDQALAISRDRHDFDRQGDRQRTYDSGLVILSALDMIRHDDNSAGDTVKLVANLARHVTMENVDLAELYRLGRFAMQIDPANVKNCTIPTGAGDGSNLSVAPAAQPLFQEFAANGDVTACEPVPGGLDTPDPANPTSGG